MGTLGSWPWLVLLIAVSLGAGFLLGRRRAGGAADPGAADAEAELAATAAVEERRRVEADLERRLTAGFEQERQVQRRARDQSRQVISETTSAVVEEIGAVVRQVDAARLAAESIDERVLQADEVTRSVLTRAEQADRLTDALRTSLERMQAVVQLIAEVAAQTNLLALNAAIEAARAGPAGRGFSVVAGEVKELARTTAESTDQIAGTIRGLEGDGAEVALAVTRMAEDVGRITDATAQLSSVAAAQRASVDELDRSAASAVARLRHMVELIEQIDQRASDRVALSGAGRLRRNGRWVDVVVVDLSDSGMGCVVRRDAVVAKGDHVEVELPLADDAVIIGATVMRRAEAGGGDDELGLRFDFPDPALIRRVEAGLLGLSG